MRFSTVLAALLPVTAVFAADQVVLVGDGGVNRFSWAILDNPTDIIY